MIERAPREQAPLEDWGGASSQNNGRPCKLDAQIGELIKAIAAVVSLQRLPWQEPLRVLLTHPRPPSDLLVFHRCMRAACRRTRHDEQFVDLLERAAAAATHSRGLGDFMAPIQLVLVAAAGAMSTRPNVSMAAARQVIEAAGLEQPLPLSFATSPARCVSVDVLRTDAMATVVAVVQRAVSSLLREHSLGTKAFSAWERFEVLAGMEAVWLAYTYCQCGTAKSGKLSADELRLDWARCGAPLWRRLDAVCRLLHAPTSSQPYSDKRADAGRLVLALMPVPAVTSHESGLFDGVVASSVVDRSTHVVCRTAIPGSSDRQDREEIARHRVLETSLRVAPMPPSSSIESAHMALRVEFPWASQTLEVIFGDLLGRANLGVHELSLPPTLLVGLPGAGKSRLARRIAELLDLPRLDVSLAGTSDTKVIGGTSRGWAGGRPSDLASLLARNQSASAIVLLDEIDKANDGHRKDGGIYAYLLGLLEPETARRHYDSFLNTECDFSKVSWLCTANTVSKIPAALQSRLRILAVPQPQGKHFPVVSDGVIAELEQRWRLPKGTLPSVDALQIDWDRLASARQVRVATEASIGLWARSLIKH